MNGIDDLSAVRGYWSFAYTIDLIDGTWRAIARRDSDRELTGSTAAGLMRTIADHYHQRREFAREAKT